MAADRAHQATGAAPDDTAWEWLSLVVRKVGGSAGASLPKTDAFAGPAPASAATACALAGEPGSAKVARDFTTTTLRGWALEELVDDVGIAASELVTNALHHGLRRSEALERSRAIRLGLLLQGPGVLCAVADPGAEVPVLKEPDFLAETGRGLHVVASLSNAWGWTTAACSGKVVWTTFSVPGRPLGAADSSVTGSSASAQ